MGKIIWGIFWMVIAFFMIRYRGRIYNFTGPWGWIERYLGPGRTPVAIVLLAIVLFFVGITIMTGFSEKMLGGMDRIF